MYTSSSPIKSKGLYLNGHWIQGNGPDLISTNPAYGSLVWEGTQATEKEIVTAANAAHQALISWSSLNFEQRASYIQEFAKYVEANRSQIAQLISEETGKPLWESQTEVTAVIGKIALSIQAYKERTWPKYHTTPEVNTCLRFKPQGVVLVLGAFNFPAHLSNGHIIPALLAGNTLLYKPSEQAPAVAELIMQCWHDSGVPAGVINCLQGGVSCAKILLEQDIQGVYFTGSYATGLKINQHFSNKPEVILALEMGGNNPLIVAEVEDIKAAVYQTLLSTLITSGQRCTCARRLIIPNTHQGDEFLRQLIAAYSNIKIAPFDAESEPFMGPVISNEHALTLLKAQHSLIKKGGEPLLHMQLLQENTGLLSPGILEMSSVPLPPDEELFGPLTQVYRYEDFGHALDLANQTRYGLAAGLLGGKEEQYRQLYQTVRAGLINWNRPTTGAASSLPFGGVGLSGNHRPSAYFAADYCSYPIASMEQDKLILPASTLPGIFLE